MTDSQPLPVEIISQSTRLESAVSQMAGEPAIAVDTESNSRHHYPEQLCLIQIATRTNIHIVDTIALKEPAPLKGILADAGVMKIIHGADYDIRCLDRHYEFRIRNLYDTSVAARFAGQKEFGLSALIKNLLGVAILKNERLQQSDWGRRPLSAEALEYAAGDVQYLFALREKLDERLQALGRTAWVAEELSRMEELRYNPPNIETAYLGVKGAQSLDECSLAVLRALCLFREEEAKRQQRPHFFVIPDYALIDLAANPKADLSKVAGLGYTSLQRFGNGLKQALLEGQAAPPIPWPPQIYDRPTHEQSLRLGRLKTWRTSLGEKLSLDPSLLWPTVSLERLAKELKTFEAELSSPNVRRWQIDQFGTSLRAYVKSL